MNMTEIEQSLNELYNKPLKDEEIRKIVFWTDVDKEFSSDYDKLSLNDVKIIHLTDHNQFQVKYMLEEEDIKSSYLVYTHLDLTSKDNWLYDIYMYSYSFFADKLSLIMNELEIGSTYRPVIEKYRAFMNSKERRRRFKALNINTYTQESIELGMMNVLTKTHSVDFETVLRSVLMDTLDDATNTYLDEFNRFFSLKTFWDYVNCYYDYDREEKTLKTLFIHLTMTAAIQTIEKEQLSQYSQFISEQNQTNAYVFINHWMNHKADFAVFNDYISIIEDELKIADVINQLPIDAFEEADIFPYIDRAIIIYITNNLIDQQEDFTTYIRLIRLRRTKHFYEQYRALYEALFYTVKMHEFKEKYTHGIPKNEARTMYDSYVQEYHFMDRYYRKFYLAYDEDKQHEVLFKLRELVEYIYTSWFMGELNTHWSEAVRNEMTENWSLHGVDPQRRFYSTHVAPRLNEDERVFVIISDAFRYEAGKELQEELETNFIGESELSTMLSVLPSITKLGMAALLPHSQLTLDDNGHVLINDQRTSGVDNRKKILSNVNENSLVLKYDDLSAMNIAEQRESFKGKKIIYIYHDTIDAIGDQARTEIDTFQAVEQAINQLSRLIRSLTSNISATNILVTADHGFLYERDELPVSDLIAKESIETIDASRRYMLSHEKKDVSGQLAINLSTVIDNKQPLYAYVPNATIRYRVQGAGSNFVHGGVSLQEVVIPLLKIKNKRKGQSGAKKIEKVDIVLTSTIRRITNSIFSLEFFQNERIAEQRIARSVDVYMEDEKNQVVSNEKTLIGDLTSENPKERVFKIQFVLKNKTYDRNKKYYLVIKDRETDVIVERIPFTINLGIVSDFDF